jgi:flagellar biosynthesis anti-sigma factor FlgM
MDIRTSTAPNSIQVTTAGTRGASAVGGVDRGAGGRPVSGAGGGREDEVQLSTLGAAIENLQPGSEAREARVEELRAAVAEGRYRVDSGAVASQIIQDAGGE